MKNQFLKFLLIGCLAMFLLSACSRKTRCNSIGCYTQVKYSDNSKQELSSKEKSCIDNLKDKTSTP